MKDLFHAFFSNNDDDDGISSDDDIDQLFLQLEQVEPPPVLVDAILASVARLPRHEFLSNANDAHKSWNEFGTLIVPTSHLQPS
jgi:hypothetical protein